MDKLSMPVICECGFSTMDAKKAVEHANKHEGDNVMNSTKGEAKDAKRSETNHYEG